MRWINRAIKTAARLFEAFRFAPEPRTATALAGMENFRQRAAPLRFGVTNLGAPKQDTPSSDMPSPELLLDDPSANLSIAEVDAYDGFAPVPNFFKAIFWSFLLFVAIPAVVIFGIYWLIWK